jgi:hypothetical protein
MLPIIINQIPLHCINEAAELQHVPAKLIMSILQVERGKVGEIVKNKNGTYDIGPLQINSTWLPELKKHGITEAQLQFDPCINVNVGAWILAKSIANGADFLSGIGNYNSHTKLYNQNYYQKVRIHFTRITHLLD